MRVTDGHPKIRLVHKRALGELGRQLLETPQGPFRVSLAEKELALPEEEGVPRFRGRLGSDQDRLMDEEDDKTEQTRPLSTGLDGRSG